MATITDTQFNDLFDEVERRLYDLEQLVASSQGLGNSSFGSITIVDPFTSASYVIDTVSSPPSGTVTVTPGSFFDTSFADVTWAAPSDGSADEYMIEWAKKTGSTYEVSDTATSGGNSYRIQPVVPGQTYGVRVYSINRLGIPSTPNPSSGYVDFVAHTDNVAPGAPTGVTVFAAIRSLVVRWNQNAEADVINGKGQYLVQIATSNAFTTIVKQEYVGANVATFDDLSSATTYWARVYAIDNSGNQSAPSASASGTTGQVVSADLLDGAVAATKLSAGSANRLMDSSFEGSYLPRYWTTSAPLGGAWALDATTHYHGLQSVRYSTTSTGSSWGVCQQEIRVTPGETIYIRFLWGQSANARQSCLKVTFNDKDGNYLPSVDWFPLGGTDGAITGGTVVTGNHVVPANAVNAFVSCMGGWSSNGSANSVNFDGIYLGNDSSISASSWAPASNEILPAVSFADMLVANAVQLRHMSADSVDGNVIKANSVDTTHISAIGLDAGVVTFGVMSGGRVAANSADIGILKTSTLATANLTVNGGSIRIGNPGGGAGTSGVLINSQGIRVYSGTTLTGTFDVSGSVSMQGAITSGSTIAIGNYSLTTSAFSINAATSYSDTRAIIWVGAGGFTQARLWTYDQGNNGVAVNGALHMEGEAIFGQASGYTLANSTGSANYITIFSNGVGEPGNVILGSGMAGSQVSVSSGTPLLVGNTGSPSIASAMEVHGYSAIVDDTYSIGELFGGSNGDVRTINSSNTAFENHTALTHINMSDPVLKANRRTVSKDELLKIVRGTSRPYRFNFKGKDKKATKIGLSSVDLPVEAQHKTKLGDAEVTMVDPQVQIAILWGALQELADEVESLREAA